MRNKTIYSVCLLLIVSLLLLHTSSVQSVTYVSRTVTVEPGYITYWNLTVNDTNSVATITFLCTSCNITFFVTNWANFSLIKPTSLKFNYDEIKLVNFNNINGLNNQKVQLGPKDAYVFALENDDLLTSKTVQMNIDITPPTQAPNEDSQNLLDLFPYIFVIFIIGIVALFGINRYKLSKSKVREPEKIIATVLPIEPVIVTSNKKIPTEVLQQYWLCPNDATRLQFVTTRVAGSPTFNVTKDKIEIGINNAIAIRKIPLESREQTLKLVNQLFSDFEIEEIMLVNTRCPTCMKYYSVPQL